jgi:small GTP-binding protein
MNCCIGSAKSEEPVLNSIKSEKKVVFLGESGVGKSSIIQIYVKGEFKEHNEVTLGGSYIQAKVQLQDSTVILDIWDTAGQERFRSLVSLYYRNSSAAILVFDVSNPESFNLCEFWVQQLRSSEPSCKLFLVANKIDREEHRVDMQKVQDFVSLYNMEYIATSAKANLNIKELFVKVAMSMNK